MSNKKKKIRDAFRTSVFKRDGYKCRVCKCKGMLDAHHIKNRSLLPNGGYVEQNGISLCEKCHIKAEKFYEVGTPASVKGFSPDDLYRLINSSYEKAYEASLRLK